MSPDAGDATRLAWAEVDLRVGEQASRAATGARSTAFGDRLRRRLARRAPTASMPELGSERPPAEVIVPTALSSGEFGGSQRVWLESLLPTLVPTLGPDDGLIVVLDPSAPADRVASLREVIRRDVQMQIVEATGEFSFSDRVNLGVANSDRPVVVLLNDDMEVLSPNWLDRLSSAAATPGVGAAGATLLYADGTIQHGGLTTTENLPTHAYYGWAPEDPVDGGRLVKDRVAWALTGACMAVSRPHWDLVGGFSELFPVNYNDVDFCLKLTQEGLVNVILGAVHLHHFETRTRPRLLGAPEVAAIQDRWLHRLGHDPLLVGTSALVDRRDPDLG